MSKSNDNSIRVTRVLRMFEKSGGSGEYTKPFSELPTSVRSDLLSCLDIEEEEVAILASYRDSESWVVLTSNRLVWRDQEKMRSLNWNQVKDATIPPSALGSLKSSVKLQNSVLEVSTDSGTMHIVIEPGRPFIGFWNVLKMVPSLA